MTQKIRILELQYMEKTFAEFESLSRFPKKVVLHLSTKFGIITP